jgi:hypothetical protein
MSQLPPYRFVVTWYAKYAIKDKSYDLYYGAFSGNKPCWHILLENNYVTELVPIDKNASEIDKIYRVKGRGVNLKFTQQKIRKIARPRNNEVHLFNSQDFVPAN